VENTPGYPYNPSINRDQPPPPPEPKSRGSAAVDKLARQLEKLQLTMADMQSHKRQQAQGPVYFMEDIPRMNTIEEVRRGATAQDLYDTLVTLCTAYEEISSLPSVDNDLQLTLGRDLHRLYEETKPYLAQLSPTETKTDANYEPVDIYDQEEPPLDHYTDCSRKSK
jgi:hypothetical protein